MKTWLCQNNRIDLTRTRVMGIVNVTPDSFSDGGQWFDPGRAVAHGLRLAAEGADILDIGGVSTRPGAGEVEEAEELRRVLPVIEGLARQTGVPLSVDTSRASVARAVIEAGACIVNDVARFDGDAEMAVVVRETGAGVVLTHSRTSHDDTQYADVVEEVKAALETALAYARAQGIAEEVCVIDPGLGFAKTTAQNVALLRRLDDLIGVAPVLIGASRKRFIGELVAHGVPAVQEIGGRASPRADRAEAAQRLGGSIGAAVWCALRGAAIVRVHDVKETVEALRIVSAIEG
ncbi:MAG: dihydropteroate synthase [Kiritimatiellaeota bacterium]|nr:dihydropteroate synthase [Kiritimatiellota bacterium]